MRANGDYIGAAEMLARVREEQIEATDNPFRKFYR
jgi:hypothetical protein